MNLIQLLLTGVCAAIGLGALLVGNCLETLLIWMMPIGYFAVTKWRASRKQRNEEFLKRKAESDAFWEKERELRAAKNKAHLDSRDREDARRNQYRQYQQQQMDMMHQNAIQQAAAQRQAAMGNTVWTDPRASYGSDLADNIVNLWAINSMMQSGTGVTRTHYDENTNSVKVQHVPTEQVYRSPDPEPSSSSSSSYSSDTSSDSYGGSDTSSDSF
jgi:hypothetical protein